jgi:RNA polymerase primary sigma factor
LQTSVAVQHIVDLGKKINSGEISAKRVSRAIRNGTTYTDEAARIQELLASITLIEEIDAKNTLHRVKLLSLSSSSAKRQPIYRHIVRGADQIYYLLRHWRLESEIIDVIEETIRHPENMPETDALIIRGILDGINNSRAKVQAAKNELINANLRLVVRVALSCN